jgi:quercetin dioxygenase-like cupin family protein
LVQSYHAATARPDQCCRQYGSINNQIDGAYRAKYKTSPYLPPIISEQSRSATVKITPDIKKGHNSVNIKRIGAQASGKGSADWFTGTVRVDPLFQAPAPARVSGASVTFERGARTAWHTHPLGQTLIVTAGAGWVQLEGESISNIYPGDVVWFGPGEKHWHGATATTAMTHIAVQETLNGKVVDWMEHVSDEQYLKTP